jgi:ABC-type glycerol-3-phosphate transport system substrate-binding protein
MKKFFCFFLASLMLLAVLVGCANTNKPSETDTADVTEGETDVAADALSQLSVDWGNDTFVIAGRDDHTPGELMVDSETRTEVLEDAVYQRNLAFEEYCKLTLSVVQKETQALSEAVKTDVKTGAGEFDLVHQHMALTANLASEGNLISYTALDGVDLSAPWWDEGTASFMISDKIYFMNSAINYSDENTTYVMLFNKRMAEDEDINPYDMVYNNEWTLDNFQTLIKDVSYDLTGDSKYD